MYDGLHDKPVKHYFSPQDVRVALTKFQVVCPYCFLFITSPAFTLQKSIPVRKMYLFLLFSCI